MNNGFPPPGAPDSLRQKGSWHRCWNPGVFRLGSTEVAMGGEQEVSESQEMLEVIMSLRNASKRRS